MTCMLYIRCKSRNPFQPYSPTYSQVYESHAHNCHEKIEFVSQVILSKVSDQGEYDSSDVGEDANNSQDLEQ